LGPTYSRVGHRRARHLRVGHGRVGHLFRGAISIGIVVLGLAPLKRGATDVAAQAPPKQAVVETSAGTFVIDLTPESAPNQAAHFMKLAADGGYDGTMFHRVVKYGMVQGGDPLTTDPSKRT